MDGSRVQVRWCADCEGETLFELPPCEDGHGEDCLDLLCVECGAGVVVGVLLASEQSVLEVHAA